MLNDFEKGIIVVGDDVFELFSFVSLQDDRIVFEGVIDEPLSFVLLLLEPSSVRWASREILHKRVSIQRLTSKVSPKHLCPRFLNENHPNLIANGRSKEGLLRS